MGHHTYGSQCGGFYDPDLVQDVEDFVQSVKDDMVMQELGSMDIVRDVHHAGSVQRVGLQRQRTTSEDVSMEDVDAESEAESERNNLVGAQHEGEDTRDRGAKTAAMTQPQQFAKNGPHPSEEPKSGSQRNLRPRVIRLIEYDSKEHPVEQVEQFRPFPDSAAMEETIVNRNPPLGGHGVIQSQPRIRPLAQKTQWIPGDDIMDDSED